MRPIQTLSILVALFFSLSTWAAEKFAIIGDAGAWNKRTQSVRDSILRAGVKDLILPGDNLYEPLSKDYDRHWRPWVSKGMNFSAVAIGNHNAGYGNEIRYFKMPGEYYAVTQGSARFIVLNSDNSKTVGEQIQWLETQLSVASEKQIFLVYHHPTYTVSKAHDWREKERFQRDLRVLLAKHRKKLTALIVGHDHLAALYHFGDLPVILSGATHEVRIDRPVNNVQDGVSVTTSWFFDSVPYWAMLELNSENAETWVHFTRAADDKVSCSAKLVTGEPAQLGAECGRK